MLLMSYNTCFTTLSTPPHPIRISLSTARHAWRVLNLKCLIHMLELGFVGLLNNPRQIFAQLQK